MDGCGLVYWVVRERGGGGGDEGVGRWGNRFEY